MVETLLNENELIAVKKCWKVISLQKKEVRASFYNKLFDLDASTKPLFRNSFLDINEVPDSFNFMFKYFEQLDSVIPEIKSLGLKHKTYGVKAKHYPLAKVALLWTFQKYVGTEFNKDMRTGWEKIFDFVSKNMILGMKRK